MQLAAEVRRTRAYERACGYLGNVRRHTPHRRTSLRPAYMRIAAASQARESLVRLDGCAADPLITPSSPSLTLSLSLSRPERRGGTEQREGKGNLDSRHTHSKRIIRGRRQRTNHLRTHPRARDSCRDGTHIALPLKSRKAGLVRLQCNPDFCPSPKKGGGARSSAAWDDEAENGPTGRMHFLEFIRMAVLCQSPRRVRQKASPQTLFNARRE